MEPYVIRQGDTLAKLAYKFGFDADTVWNDPKNADLRKIRSNPDILWPSDILYIPDQVGKTPDTTTLTTGAVNSFVSDAPTKTIAHKFQASDASTYASKAFVVQELEHLTGLQTTADGVATFPVPVTLDRATIVLTDTGETWSLSIGGLDPINTLSGIFQRLQNLGYIPQEAVYDTDESDNNLPLMRYALQGLRVAREGGGAAAPLPGAPPTEPPTPDPGLADDGTLDADTAALLLQVHGV
jgi:hypothetical protein